MGPKKVLNEVSVQQRTSIQAKKVEHFLDQMFSEVRAKAHHLIN